MRKHTICMLDDDDDDDDACINFCLEEWRQEIISNFFGSTKDLLLNFRSNDHNRVLLVKATAA